MASPAERPVPEGMNTVTTQLFFDGDASRAIETYRAAFGAEPVGEVARTPDGKVMHAMLRVGDSSLPPPAPRGPAGDLASPRDDLIGLDPLLAGDRLGSVCDGSGVGPFFSRVREGHVQAPNPRR